MNSEETVSGISTPAFSHLSFHEKGQLCASAVGKGWGAHESSDWQTLFGLCSAAMMLLRLG